MENEKRISTLKVILFANTAWYLYNFRLPLAQALVNQGYQVVLLSPGEEPYHQLLQENGFQCLTIHMQRRKLNPLAEIQTVWQIFQIYHREVPDIVHHFTIKPVLYGSLASHLLRIRQIINAVTGLGYVFVTESLKAKLLRTAARLTYRLALQKTLVIFQNPDDMSLFLQMKLVKPAQTTLIRGSGVAVEHFLPMEEPPGVPLIILPARMLWDKGIKEFVEAARHLKAKGIQARFALVGSPDPGNPQSVPEETLKNWHRAGTIEWWGWREEMASVYQSAHIVCLPSYREGTPKSLLEAAACGRPIIATNVPGCREIVQDGYNGYLINNLDPDALANALQKLIEDPGERQRMGKNGRQLAVAEFALNRVIEETLGVYAKSAEHTQPVHT
jgi:glycosyltransferase involved in cell wall biosynthesis